jgi:gliding motility associated protien GldN
MNKTSSFNKSLLVVGLILSFSNTWAQVKKMDPYTFGNINTKLEPSLEDVNAFFPDSLIESKKKGKFPLQMPILRKEDVMYVETIIEDIDTREKKNRHFIYQANDENGDQRFLAVLIGLLVEDSANLTAYSPFNDRFTSTLSVADIRKIFNGPTKIVLSPRDDGSGLNDSTEVPDPGKETPEADQVTTFRIKAQHIFDNRTSRMYYRIIGIAPVARMKQTVPADVNGETIQREEIIYKPLFWLYYPKLRKSLAEKKMYNPKNQKSMTDWAYVLEHRYFDSHIIKTSYENFADKEIKEMKEFKKDPKKRLLESDKIRQRIDDLDEDRWVY